MQRLKLTSLRGLPLVLLLGCSPALTVGEKDLPDGQGGEAGYQDPKDEIDPKSPKGEPDPGSAPAKLFTCADKKTQIESHLVCSGKPECPDASDEAGCGTSAFVCKDGSSIAVSLLCNNVKECKDGSDEVGCLPPVFYCKDGSGKVESSSVCNGNKECKDGSDETNCAAAPFYCKDGTQKIDAAFVCDHKADCKDYSDETGCPNDSFLCRDGTKIDELLICNKDTADCPDGSDVEACSAPLFRCDDWVIITDDRHCDGRKDCAGGEDESRCDDLFYCKDGRKLAPESVCDGKLDCGGYDDEVSCVDGVPEKCPGDVSYAIGYDFDKACWLSGIVPIGCSEPLEPADAVPTNWGTGGNCVRRKSDGRIFGATSLVPATKWDDCSAEEQARMLKSSSCP